MGIAHNLGMEVIAEGAETEHHVELLRELGCELAQGYHFAPPAPAEEIAAILQTSTARTDVEADPPADETESPDSIDAEPELPAALDEA
jgi:predicted signal transduction protein with EAL and GGDEF domain